MAKLIVTFLMFSNFLYASVSLRDSFNSALKLNQQDAINNSKINQIEEQITAGRSGYYPKINLKGVYTKQENLNDTHYANLNLSQSIFKGGKDYLGVKLLNNSKEMATYTKSSDQIALYQTVISAFYNYFLYENDAKNYEQLALQSKERVNEISKRVKIGRSRKGEQLQAEAQLAQAHALLVNARGLAKESGEKFSRLTGIFNQVPAVELSPRLNKFNVDSILQKAFSRPDVSVYELKIDEAQTNLSIAKAGIAPTLDLTSNYYLTKRIGTSYASSKTNWDVGLTLTLPLFEGFSTDSKINESIEKEHEARFNFMNIKKNIELDISSKLETHNRYLDQLETFSDAQNLASKSYEEALKDYRLGLISNLDVLTALNLFLDTKRNNEKNIIQVIMSEKLLEAGQGLLP